jgi:16S rRNA G966 N2-methylase RsmD
MKAHTHLIYGGYKRIPSPASNCNSPSSSKESLDEEWFKFTFSTILREQNVFLDPPYLSVLVTSQNSSGAGRTCPRIIIVVETSAVDEPQDSAEH